MPKLLSAVCLTHMHCLQVFALEQSLIFEYQGVNYELKVNDLLVTDRSGAAVGATRAQLVPTTAMLFQIPPGSNIQLLGGPPPPPKQLFKQTDINFEKLGIGGLDSQFEQIFRRAFASRVFPPDVVEKLGIHHVKGLLLFGPPGTGKGCCAVLCNVMCYAASSCGITES